MLSRFFIKKPFYVFVFAIIVIILGAVSLSYMKTDLLPDFEVPYLAVITTDPGASPEAVDNDVTSVLEQKLGTVSGVKNVYSTSAENYSLIYLEFSDDTNMDSALVKVSASVNSVASQLPDGVGTPYYMEMNMDMVATTYIGVSDDDMDAPELSRYATDTIIPALERQNGVANVTATGGVTDSVSVELNQDKIDNVNDGILGNVNDKLAAEKAKLDSATSKLESASSKLDTAQNALDAQKKMAADGYASADAGLNALLASKAAYEAQITVLQMQLLQATDPAVQANLQSQIDSIQAIVDGISPMLDGYTAADAAKTSTVLSLAEAQNKLDDAKSTIAASLKQLETGKTAYESARKAAGAKANIDSLVTASTLSKIIQAQNLEAPAGYIDSNDGDRWMLKVGENYKTVDQLKDMVLTKIAGVGDVTLEDVADITLVNDSGDNYAKLNGRDGLILAVSKTSTANTGEVSDRVNAELGQLTAAKPGLSLVPIMDQGKYIDLYIQTILKSLLIGALLAVVVLALFLRNVRPTIVVAFSIPFSVLFSLVVMYFVGLTINIMTLGAMSLAIGMLVDNSVVVMENIYRLKARGLSAPRAAAQGALQVTGAVAASTITHICVFFPFVFSSGTVRQLMVPFALTISLVLLASLLVALTVVPAMGSRLFKNAEPREYRWFEKTKEAYGRALTWCLRRKAPVLILAVVLLIASAAIVVNMGVVMMPETVSDQVQLQVKVPDDMKKAEGYKVADQVMDRIQKVDGVSEVAATDGGSGNSLMMGAAASATDAYTGSFQFYILVDSSKISTEQQMKDLTNNVLQGCSGLNCTVSVNNQSMSMGSLSGSGVTIAVSGTDSNEVLKLSDQVVTAVKSVQGYKDVSNGQENADKTLHLVFDKNEVARLGTTVAQVYQQVATKLAEAKTAMELEENGQTLDVKVDDSAIDPLTKENLLDMKFTTNSGKSYRLSKVAQLKVEEGVKELTKQNLVYTTNVTADVADGYNVTLLARQLQPELDKISVPANYKIDLAGTNKSIQDMMQQMALLLLLGIVLIYLVMVAQFQSLLSPFIIIFTIPLAFTGGLLSLFIAGQQLSMMSMLGFIILMGTVVNNGIVFVDYVNRLRMGGMAKRAALVAGGQTRMRPIVMTALTTIFGMASLVFNPSISSGMERGMAIVVAGGLLYATIMTLFIEPIIYDIFCHKPLRPIDLSGDMDKEPDDAAEFIALMGESARETYDYESRRQRRKRLRLGSAGSPGTDARDAAQDNPADGQDDQVGQQ